MVLSHTNSLSAAERKYFGEVAGWQAEVGQLQARARTAAISIGEAGPAAPGAQSLPAARQRLVEQVLQQQADLLDSSRARLDRLERLADQ